MLYLSLLYCCHGHFSLVIGMVIKYLPVSSYTCVNLFCMCIVLSIVAMSFSGLYSNTVILLYDIIVGGGINLGFLACMGARCVCTIFLK